MSDALRSFFVAERVARNEGLLQSRDARTTLLSVGALALATVVSRTPTVLLGLGCVATGLAYASAVPVRTLLRRVALVAVPAALVVGPQAVVVPGDPVVARFGLTVTDAGLVYAATSVLRVAVGAACLSLLVLTTPVSELFGALRAFHVPRTVVWVLAITYRYLFLFFDELRRLALARAGRTNGEDGLRGGWRDARALAGTFLLRTVERGERVGRGMRARGGTRAPNPYTRTSSLAASDYALLVGAAACLLVSGVVRWTL